MSEQLRECPFCGSDAEIWNFNNQNRNVRIVCKNYECKINTEAYKKLDWAIAAWNTRPIEDKLREQRDRAMGLLEKAVYDIKALSPDMDLCLKCIYDSEESSEQCGNKDCWRWQHADEYEHLNKEIDNV